MKTVGVFEAKTRFSALIADAIAGESTIVTKNGKPVAEIGPVKSTDATRAKLAAERIRALRGRLSRGGKLKGINIRDLMNEGRK
jgi:prevent-host-death family protein